MWASSLLTTPHVNMAPAALRALTAVRRPATVRPPGLQHRASRRGLQAQTVRCMASKRDDDKSWGEIASDAVEVGKTLFKKVGSTVSKAASAVSEALVQKEEGPDTRQQRESERLRRREEELPLDLGRGGGLLGGLVGRAVGSMLSGAVREMGRQFAEAQQQADEVQRRAASIIETSRQVQESLGAPVRVGAAVSQSSATQIINGATTKQIALLLPVSSPRGVAQAEVSFAEGGRSGTQQDFSIRLLLPSGQVLNLDVDSSSSNAAGRTIDVEWREL